MQHYTIHCNGLLHMEQVALLEAGLTETTDVSMFVLIMYFSLT